MPRALTLFAGVTFVTLLTYQSRINLISNTAHVQQQIDQAKEKADQITNKPNNPIVRLSLRRPTSSVEQFFDNSRSYYNGRLVPSVKESWNAQIINVTSAVIQSNLPDKVCKFVLKNIFGHDQK